MVFVCVLMVLNFIVLCGIMCALYENFKSLKAIPVHFPVKRIEQRRRIDINV